MRANFISTLSVNATSTVPNAILVYSLDSGRLPPGITLAIDGQLQGKVRQFGEVGKPGLTTIDKNTGAFTLDGGTTTLERSYTFTETAQDQFGFSATTRTFTITTTDPDAGDTFTYTLNTSGVPFEIDEDKKVTKFATSSGVPSFVNATFSLSILITSA